MESDRDAFCERIGAVPQLPLNDFLHHFMPRKKLTEKELDQVKWKLRQKSRPREHFDEEDANIEQRGSQRRGTRRASPETGNGGSELRTDYARLPPHCHDAEKGTHGDLVDIHAKIVQCCLKVKDELKQTLALRSCETLKTESEEAQSLLPGGVHQLIAEQDSMFKWHSVVVVEEYDHVGSCGRKASTSRAGLRQQVIDRIIVNSKKVLWSMHQMLRSDVRRRFTFGITFADTEVRLWHLNRAVAVVSEPFDLYTDMQVLADFYSRLAFATLDELGYDPNIELVRNLPSLCQNRAHPDQYRITVCGEAYITVELLADHAAERGLGKCTRVYRAYKESDASIESKGRTFYVIKDCWVESGKRTEYEIYEAIMKRIEEHDWQGLHDAAPTNITELLQFEAESKLIKPADALYGLSVDERKKFFVKIIAGEKVEVGGVVDDTHAVIGRGCSFPIESRKVYAVCERAILRVGEEPVLCGVVTYKHGIEIGLPVHSEGCFLGEISALQHHRIVMEEGQVLLDNPEIKSVFSTVKDASYALFLLHSIGLVYGDVSPGNILRRPYDRGVLADFESVGSVTDPTLGTMRTGTPDFCALEVVLGDFLAGKPQRSDTAKRTFRDPDEPKEKPAPPLQAPAEGDNRLAWKFRDAHDLESVFWLVLWLLLRHDAEGLVSPKYDAERKYDEFYTKIFPHTFYNSPARFRALADPDFLEQTLGTLPPEWNKYLEGALAILREELWEVYRARNKPLPPTLWAMVYLTCAMGERVSGSFVPPALEGVTSLGNNREKGSASVNAKAEGAATGICGSARKVGDKREREEVDSDAGEVVKELECLTEPEVKRRKPTIVSSQSWSLRS